MVSGCGCNNICWWRFKFQPYIKNWQMMNDPSGEGNDWSSPNVQGQGNYGYNTWLANTSIGAIPAPAGRILFSDARHWAIPSCWPGNVAYPTRGSGYPVCGANDLANRTPDHTRHNGGSNLAFADGHAKWMNAQEIITQADSLKNS